MSVEVYASGTEATGVAEVTIPKATTGTTGIKTIVPVVREIIPSNSKRASIVLRNLHTTDPMLLGFSATNTAWRLEPGQLIVFAAYEGPIFGKSGTGQMITMNWMELER